MMFEEDPNAKSGVFSHLFDWNRKSRKKLFANGSASSGGKKLAGGSNSNMQGSSFWMDGHDGGKDPRGAASAKKSGECSRATSVAEEEVLLSGTKVPGVVARLMGLDALPTSGVQAPNSSPLLPPRYLMEGGQDQERARALDVGAHHVDLSRGLDNPYPRKQEDLKHRKMTSSAVEKFGIEVLPPQLTRPSQVSQYKLLSPMRNPRFISPENAADIMEAAARMCELGLRGDSSLISTMWGSFSLPMETNEVDPPGGKMDSPSPLSHPETLQRSPLSNARKKLGDGNLNRSWNAPEIGAASSGQKRIASKGGKSRGKSNPTGAMANANVQIKMGMGSNIRKSSLTVAQQDESKVSRPVRNQSHMQQTKMEKRAVSAPSTSGVLKPHKQKRNSMVERGKLPTLPSSSSQQLTNDVKGDARLMRNKSSNIIRVSSKHQAGNGSSYPGKEPASKRAIGNPRNRSLGDAEVKKSELLANNIILRKDKSIQSNIIIDERLNVKQDKDRRKSGADVVSFTFTSPVTKAMSRQSSSTNKAAGKLDRSSRSYLEDSRSATNPKNKSLPIVRVNVISDDSGNDLPEHNVHKLAVGLEPTCFPGMKVSNGTSSADSVAASKSFSAEVAEDGTSLPCLDETDSIGCFPSFTSPSLQSSVQKPIAKEQVGEDLKDCDISNVPESDQRLPSPFSTLEACFSGESCESSESCSSITGQDQDLADSAPLKEEFQTVEEETDESSFTLEEKNLCGSNVDMISRRDCVMAADEEMDYVRDILSIAMLHSNESNLANTKLVLAPDLYHQLEIKKSWSEASESESIGSLKRKLLFDCVNECLDLRYRHNPLMGLESWIDGRGLRKDQAAEEVCREIMLWRSMERWVVDERVDRDFCGHLGRCANLKADSFEIGVKIQEMILTILIDETVAEFSLEESGKVDITCWNLDHQVDFQTYCLYCL